MKGQLLYHQSYVYRLHTVGVLIFDLGIGATALFVVLKWCSEEWGSDLVVHNILYTMLFTVNTVKL